MFFFKLAPGAYPKHAKLLMLLFFFWFFKLFISISHRTVKNINCNDKNMFNLFWFNLRTNNYIK